MNALQMSNGAAVQLEGTCKRNKRANEKNEQWTKCSNGTNGCAK